MVQKAHLELPMNCAVMPYFEHRDTLVGDVSLRDSGEPVIVIYRKYQNRHIGRRCITEVLTLTREKA